MEFEFHDNKIGSLFVFPDDIKKNENRFSATTRKITILRYRNKTAAELEGDGLPIR